MIMFSSKNGFSNLGQGDAIIGRKNRPVCATLATIFFKKAPQNQPILFFIFFINQRKKGCQSEIALNETSYELCGRQQCKFKIVDDFTIKNVDHGNDQV